MIFDSKLLSSLFNVSNLLSQVRNKHYVCAEALSPLHEHFSTQPQAPLYLPTQWVNLHHKAKRSSA